MPAVVLGNLFAFGLSMPFAFPLQGASVTDWSIVMYLGVCQIGLAYVFLTGALRHVPVLEAAILLLVEPALNPVWAWLVHGETPGVWPLAGGAIILGATLLRTWLDARGSPMGAAASPGAATVVEP